LEDGLTKLTETTLSEVIRMVPHEAMKSFRSRNEAQGEVGSMIQGSTRPVETALGEGALPRNFTFSNPLAESAKVDLMLQSYRNLWDECGGNPISIDAADFREFIISSYDHISEHHRAERVSFTIQEVGGQVDISAMPVGAN
jgi:hypothetical protein